jgi:NitT/TauT family transport system substrate-binding protein
LRVGYQPYYSEAWSGVLIRALRLDEKYLPPGSTVQFEIGIKGGIVLTNAIQSGRHAISYLGLAPTARVIHPGGSDEVRAIAVTATSDDQCGMILGRTAGRIPATADTASALRWLDGKRVGVPSRTCADLFLTRVLSIAPGTSVQRLDQSIDVLGASLELGTVDAVSVWEPTASELIEQGLATPLVMGHSVGLTGGAFLVMRGDLIAARPDVVRGWLAAEREAQAMLADPGQREQIIALLSEQIPGISPAALRATLATRDNRGKSVARMHYPFVPDSQTMELLIKATADLAASGDIASATMRKDSVDVRWASEPGSRSRGRK